MAAPVPASVFIISSPTTYSMITSPLGCRPAFKTACSAMSAAAFPPFMSHEPRPQIWPSMTSPLHGPALAQVGVRSGRYHVHVAVEEQRPTAAGAAELADQVGAALFRFPHIRLQAHVFHERLAELVHAGLAAPRGLLVDARIGRVHRRDADGVDGHLDQVIGQSIDLGQYTFANLRVNHPCIPSTKIRNAA